MSSSFVSNKTAAAGQDISLPRLYRVVLVGDSRTPASFMCTILRKLFSHDPASAIRITAAAGRVGRALAGTYVREIAEAKAEQAAQSARLHGWPLRCLIEPENKNG
ncbi:MAG: ATP-dependent Clp protease adaptor ClpS [Betaproteobacteria bacterium]|nr:ATP-dependent Clp protease adaptor ClpS [Betaproteobacteria bacterium]